MYDAFHIPPPEDTKICKKPGNPLTRDSYSQLVVQRFPALNGRIYKLEEGLHMDKPMGKKTSGYGARCQEAGNQ